MFGRGGRLGALDVVRDLAGASFQGSVVLPRKQPSTTVFFPPTRVTVFVVFVAIGLIFLVYSAVAAPEIVETEFVPRRGA